MNVPIWWDVIAVDGEGNARVSEQLFGITLVLGNSEPPATIFVDVKDENTGQLLVDSNVNVIGSEIQGFQSGKGKFIATVRGGAGTKYTIAASADGYTERDISIEDIQPNERKIESLSLSRKPNRGLLTVQTKPVGIPISLDDEVDHSFPLPLEIGTDITLDSSRGLANITKRVCIFWLEGK